jgi:hypothetical protein
MTVGVMLGRLQPFNNNKTLLVDEQNTGDIIEAITKAHKKYAPEYKKISSFFNSNNDKETARRLYNFCKKNIQYVIEPGEKQTVKSPAAILATGHGDCKHYAGFIGGCLGALGIPFSYRFASYKTWDKQPAHVFIVVNPGTFKEIWIDPVLPAFDYKKQYTYAKDKIMSLYSISGVSVGKATKAQKAQIKQLKKEKRKATGAEKQAIKTELKSAKKAAGVTLGQKIKKGATVVLKVAGAPARNAFLLLVKINFANLAVKMSKAWEKSPSRLTNFWEGIGGKIQALKTQWEKGKTKKRIFGTSIGEPATAAAAATAAAPIIVKVTKLLKDIGIEPEELLQIGKDAINEKAQELVKNALAPKAVETAENIQEAGIAMEAEGTTQEAPETSGKTPGNMLPLIIGGAALVYFATRKR